MIAAGDRLRDLREDKGKTQAEISSLILFANAFDLKHREKLLLYTQFQLYI